MKKLKLVNEKELLYMPSYDGSNKDTYNYNVSSVFFTIRENTEHIINDMNAINSSGSMDSVIDGLGDIADALCDTLNHVHSAIDYIFKNYELKRKDIERYRQEYEARQNMSKEEYLKTKLWESRSVYDPVNMEIAMLAADIVVPVVQMINKEINKEANNGNKGEIIESETQNLIESPEDEGTNQ